MDEILMLFKLNIGVTSDAKKPLFVARIRSTIDELARRGVIIDEQSSDDQILVADYAAWLHEKRNSNDPVPTHIEKRISRRKTRARSEYDA